MIVIGGGTDGMGRGLALARAIRGDRVIAIGNSESKGTALVAEAAARGVGERIRFFRADLSTIAGTRQVMDRIAADYQVVDALALFANRQGPTRRVTAEGLENTFALYYLSRYLLGYGLLPLLSTSDSPVVVNVAGVGMTKGSIHWDDLQLERKYSMIQAQLQAGRANDLLGVAFAERVGVRVPYVLYHPGFTKSGDLSSLPAAIRAAIKLAAKLSAHSIEESIAPIHEFIENPPDAPLSAIDRGKHLPLTLETLDPADAKRLAEATEDLLNAHDAKPPAENG
jgi:NAD(P)-dependent dehydrogenase (short-subunit alcohol dehydrogenase family)